ncbi:MAG TPA: hypothetical protein VF092_24370 [Longimicrobium sp.]
MATEMNGQVRIPRNLWSVRNGYLLVLLVTLILYALLLVSAVSEGPARAFLRDAHGDVVWLVFILVPILLLALSFFRVTLERRPADQRWWRALPSMTVSLARVSAAVVFTLGLCVLFGAVLSSSSNEDALVYVLGFAALIIGGQHLVEFESAQKSLNEINGHLRDTDRDLQTTDHHLQQTTEELTRRFESFETRANVLNRQLGRRVTELAQTIGYAQYRKLVNKAYGNARTRILGSTNHWPVDPRFWTTDLNDEDCLESPDFWARQDVFKNIRNAIRETRAGEHELRITFAGRLNILSAAGAPKLSPRNFNLFVGMLWRLALARQLRREMRASASSERYRRESEVRVMVADIPINAHVIDDRAFLLLHLPGSETGQSYGLEISSEAAAAFGGPAATVSVADVYAEIIERYTRTHVRSAREYAASLLVFAAVANIRPTFDDLRLVDDGRPVKRNVNALLDALGREEWAKNYDRNRELWNAVGPNGEGLLMEGVSRLACDLLKHAYSTRKIYDLPGRVEWRTQWNPNIVTIDRVIEDLL